jgi:hypothetical protein
VVDVSFSAIVGRTDEKYDKTFPRASPDDIRETVFPLSREVKNAGNRFAVFIETNVT